MGAIHVSHSLGKILKSGDFGRNWTNTKLSNLDEKLNFSDWSRDDYYGFIWFRIHFPEVKRGGGDIWWCNTFCFKSLMKYISNCRVSEWLILNRHIIHTPPFPNVCIYNAENGILYDVKIEVGMLPSSLLQLNSCWCHYARS